MIHSLSLKEKRKWHGSLRHLDKSWRIRGDVKVTLDAVHYLKGEKMIKHGLSTITMVQDSYNSKNLKYVKCALVQLLIVIL